MGTEAERKAPREKEPTEENENAHISSIRFVARSGTRVRRSGARCQPRAGREPNLQERPGGKKAREEEQEIGQERNGYPVDSGHEVTRTKAFPVQARVTPKRVWPSFFSFPVS
jgi:hypothetical protein